MSKIEQVMHQAIHQAVARAAATLKENDRDNAFSIDLDTDGTISRSDIHPRQLSFEGELFTTFTNIDTNKPMNAEGQPKVGMKVRDLAGGRIAKITGVYESDDEVWMISGNDIGVCMLSHFWELFEEVQS